MPYNLAFKESALKEWGELDRLTREQFKKKLSKRLEQPRMEADKVDGLENTFKIKLRAVGLRMVYVVDEQTTTVTIYAVGKRDKKKVYRKAKERMKI
jgi:mRNA interferase RelE/StbE